MWHGVEHKMKAHVSLGNRQSSLHTMNRLKKILSCVFSHVRSLIYFSLTYGFCSSISHVKWDYMCPVCRTGRYSWVLFAFPSPVSTIPYRSNSELHTFEVLVRNTWAQIICQFREHNPQYPCPPGICFLVGEKAKKHIKWRALCRVVKSSMKSTLWGQGTEHLL